MMRPLALAASLGLAAAADPAALVTDLPGLEGYDADIYAGYVDIPGGKHVYYHYYESQGSPADDPVVLWMNGGPGCSSLLGALTEHGPFSVGADGQALELNPYAWNLEANMIYVEAPAGVGFSWADNATTGYVSGDDAMQADMKAFVQGWFELFPERADNGLWITGESYAGHYVPLTAAALLDSPLAASLRGTISGNPSTDGTFERGVYWPFMAWHALVSDELYQQGVAACGPLFNGTSDACADIETQMREPLSHINPYDVEGSCVVYKPEPSTGGCAVAEIAAALARGEQPQGPRTGQTYVPCYDFTKETDWLNSDAVKAAMHVSPDALEWDVCSQVLDYNQYDPTMLPLYEQLLDAGLRVLAFSGDVDSCVPYLGTQRAFSSLGETQDAWQPWWVGEQTSGFVKTIARPNGTLAYATVRGAGHMVASVKPAEALAMFQRWVGGKDLL